jgi:hypothetical protein
MRAFTFFLLVLLSRVPVYAENAYEVLVTPREEKPAHRLVAFYQRRISRRDGPRCLFYPTCSAFYDQALTRYGAVWGTLMTLDRLLYRERQGSMKRYRYDAESRRYVDPVEHNFIFDTRGYYR